MAPSPENDNTPKAPDKADKGRTAREAEQRGREASVGPDSVAKDISVTSLDDGQLKELLDEALTYKTPRDREGKSELFKTLLTDAEDQIRKDKAKTASGPELARYYNTTANRRRNKRQPSSISENLTHGGSLNDLAKEELYVSASHLQRPKKTVSARQREGGSLPCNVNAGASYDKQFFLEEQAKRKNKITEKLEYTTIDMESEFLLENDSLGQDYNSCSSDMETVQTRVSRQPSMYTSKATLQISNVDDCISFPTFDRIEKVSSSCSGADEAYKHMPDIKPHYGVLLNTSGNKWPFNTARHTVLEEKKVDENGNALGHSNTIDNKKRKKSGKKVEDVMKAEDVKGHRADIINNIDMLVEFISGEDKAKGPVKSKLNKHVSEDKGKQHKQRTRSSKGAKGSVAHHHASLQKSNSMEEMSTTKLEDFNFESQVQSKLETVKIPLRTTKSNAERPRERKSWVLCSELYQNASAENLESADFTFVTKKKKSKKRRNSLGSRKQVHASEVCAAEFHRVPSPRRKSVCSAPHSEKSIDSSDADSVNSLSIDDPDNEPLNQPISYADIAKSAEKQRCNKQSVDKKKCGVQEKPVKTEPEHPPAKPVKPKPEPEKEPVVITPVSKTTETPPVNNKTDLTSLQNWPEIRNNKTNAVKTLFEGTHDWPTIQNNGIKNQATDNKLKSPPVQKMHRPPINNLKSKSPPKQLEEPEAPVPVNINIVKENNILNNTHKVIQSVSEQQQKFSYQCQMPPNIRDVQSIEKMQYKNLQNSPYVNNGAGDPLSPEHVLPVEIPVVPIVAAPVVCEFEKRPAVVILSGADKHISDITFGFDINEQLLSGDICADFVSRFFTPEVPHMVHIDQLVDYIGAEWEDIIVQTNSGKVKYYTEDL